MDCLIFITGKWCTTCKGLLPHVEKTCKERGITIKVLDMEKDEAEVAKHNPTSLPTILYKEFRLDGVSAMAAVNQILTN